MNSINVDIGKLLEHIEQLKKIKAELTDSNQGLRSSMIDKNEKVKGDVWEAICNMYRALDKRDKAIINLTTNTIEYLNSVKKLQEKDIAIGKKIKE